MSAPSIEQLQDAVADLLSGERETTRREIDLIKGVDTETRQRLGKLDDIVRSLEVSNRAELIERELAALTEHVKTVSEQPFALKADVEAASEKVTSELDGRIGSIAVAVSTLQESDAVKTLEQKVKDLSIDVGAIDLEKDEIVKDISTALELIKEVEEKHRKQFDELASAFEEKETPELPDIDGKMEELESKLFDHLKTMGDQQEIMEKHITIALAQDRRIRAEAIEHQTRVDETIEALKDAEKDNQKSTEHQLAEIDVKLKAAQEHVAAKQVSEADIMAAVDQKLQEERETWSEKMTTRFEMARLDAELWKETTKHEIGRVDLRLEESSELFDALTSQIQEVAAKKKELEDLHKTISAQRIEHVGGYKNGMEYKRGQMVGRDGATFICVADQTYIDPREKTDEPKWRLMAARGEPGTHIKPVKGDPGGAGKAGKDGVSFLGAEIKGGAIVLVSSDGQAHRIDLSETIEGIVDARLAAKATPAGHQK